MEKENVKIIRFIQEKCCFLRHTEPVGEVSSNAIGVVSFCQNEMDFSFRSAQFRIVS